MTRAVAIVRDISEESAPTTRCRILATAEEAFRLIGYQKTTVADIAKTLRMSPANVYRFFESKKAIHEAVIQRLMDDTEQRVALAAVAPGRNAAQRIAGVITVMHQACVERCEANPRLHEMVEAAITESWDVCRAHVDAIGSVLRRLVQEGVDTGEFEVADPAIAAACIHTGIIRYCHPALVSHYPDAGAPPVAAMIDFLLGSLRRKA
ncbi:TetR family transcriptional regulator [Methylobacterium sp. Leaf104]|uniref:TetR/AcrR family transcriptional regulator n=1 Tax=Methylobacterium TaxID=407 RepID=UPI0006F92A1B|nr:MULTISPECIES: TetR/AcrR family transcriptional regulator [Methylobacterium]KQP30525.1 TetR family transcriptional regulator [Methylobacterium sp. Leaf104]MCI9882095.1 TetR family transcriptional regulator [Methylobacterium goesingense]